MLLTNVSAQISEWCRDPEFFIERPIVLAQPPQILFRSDLRMETRFVQGPAAAATVVNAGIFENLPCPRMCQCNLLPLVSLLCPMASSSESRS